MEIQGTGQPVVLIHGFPFDHTMWQAQIEALAPVCRVIAPDLRGFGQAKFTDDSEHYAAVGIGMDEYAAELATQLDEIGVTEPVILCGFSMGGYILWQFVKQFPERVKAIALLDTRAIADTAEAAAGRIKMAGEVLQAGSELVVEAMLPKLLASATQASRPQVVSQVTEMIRQADPAAIAAAQRGMARRADMREELTSFDWPALVVVGAEDAISPPMEMRSIADGLPQATYCQVDGAGHMTTLENPAAVNQALLDFVTSVGAA